MIEAWFNSSEMTASSGPEKRFKQSAVGVEARGVEDRVFGAEKGGDSRFKFLVNGLRAANETHGRHSVAPTVKSLVGRGADGGVLRQSKVVVGAKVEDLAFPDAPLDAPP